MAIVTRPHISNNNQNIGALTLENPGICENPQPEPEYSTEAPVDREQFSPDLAFTCDIDPQEQGVEDNEGPPTVDLQYLGTLPDNPMGGLEEDEKTTAPTEVVESEQLSKNLAEASDAPQVTPLHVPIDLLGDPGLPEHRKVQRVLSIGNLLKDLGVNAGLAEEIGQVSDMLGPLGAMVLARKPNEVERVRREGRGDYHEDIPVGDTRATIYVKGTGTESSFDQGQGPISGFPTNPNDMFYDDLGLRQHARILGTESVRGAAIEAVNAAVIFAHVANEKGFMHIEDAIRAGVTVPLNVLEFPELSEEMGKLLSQRRAGDTHILDEKALGWDGYDHLGSVEMIVPSPERLDSGYRANLDCAAQLLTDPEAARTTGRTLRTLADAGWYVCRSSAHAQNMYRNNGTYPDGILLAQADNSDLFPLGDCRGARQECGEGFQGNKLYREVSPENQRIIAIYKQLSGERLLTPLQAPINTPSVRITWEQIVETGKHFWSEMLKDLAHPDAIDKMVRLMPLLRPELTIAASSLIINNGDEQKWRETADQRREVLGQLEARYGVLSEYEARLAEVVPDREVLPAIIGELRGTGKLESSRAEAFLVSGSPYVLDSGYTVAKAARLLPAIESIPEPEIRDRILNLCSATFGSRDISSLDEKPDIYSAFECRHYDTIRELIENGRYHDAQDALNAFMIANVLSSKSSEKRNGEIAGHAYMRRMLDPNADYASIRQQAECEYYIDRLSLSATTGGQNMQGLIRQLLSGEKPPASIASTATRLGRPGINHITTAVLGRLNQSDASREPIHSWAEQYLEMIERVREPYPREPIDLDKVFDDLDQLTAQYADEIPELALLHDCHAAGLLATCNPERAQRHFEHGMAYYRSRILDREEVAGMPVESWSDESYYTDTARFQLIAKQYRDMGLRYLSNFYAEGRRYSTRW